MSDDPPEELTAHDIRRSPNRWVILAIVIGFFALLVPGLINTAPTMVESLQSGDLGPQVTEVRQISEGQQLTAVSIFIPIVLLVTVELASVARTISTDVILRSRWNRLTVIHGAIGFILIEAYDIAILWGDFLSPLIGFIIITVWALLPLIEIQNYDILLNVEDGEIQFFGLAFIVNFMTALVVTTYISEITELSPSPLTESGIYFSFADSAFRLILLVSAVYLFVWALEQDIHRNSVFSQD